MKRVVSRCWPSISRNFDTPSGTDCVWIVTIEPMKWPRGDSASHSSTMFSQSGSHWALSQL